MATSVTFILKDPQSDGETLIFLLFRFNHYEVTPEGKKKYTTLKISTGERIIPKYWEGHPVYCGKMKRGSPDPTELNQRLTNIETGIIDIYRRLVNDGNPVTPDILRVEINKAEQLFPNRGTSAIKTAYIPQPETKFIPYIEDFINNTKVIYKGGSPYPIHERTKKKYRTTLKVLKEYSELTGLTKFDEIDREFYEGFIAYLQKERTVGEKKKPGYGQNTIGKYIANLKTFLNRATEEGVNTNLDFKKKKFAVPSEEVEKIYLRESELLSIYNLDLSHSKSLEAVRDLFLIGCYTALRYSDYTNIKPENIVQTDQGDMIKITTQKTRQKVMIPLHYIVREILQKYDNQLPWSISNQKTNDHLKIIGEKAKINEKVSITKTIGGLTKTITRPKHDLITSHTARRTGSTNMYLAGIPVHSIMRITGHRTEKSFLRYLRFDEEDNARILQSNEYFTKSPLKIVNQE